MAKVSIKGKNNIFYKARINSNRREYSSRLLASAELHINEQRLNRIELDKVQPYDIEVLSMAEAYNAPYLVEHFCSNICKIGAKLGCKFSNRDTDNVFKSSIVYIETLKEAEKARDRVLKILADGEISDDELDELNMITESLNQIMNDILTLKMSLDKAKRERR